jgi:hypothetical protein
LTRSATKSLLGDAVGPVVLVVDLVPLGFPQHVGVLDSRWQSDNLKEVLEQSSTPKPSTTNINHPNNTT